MLQVAESDRTVVTKSDKEECAPWAIRGLEYFHWYLA